MHSTECVRTYVGPDPSNPLFSWRTQLRRTRHFRSLRPESVATHRRAPFSARSPRMPGSRNARESAPLCPRPGSRGRPEAPSVSSLGTRLLHWSQNPKGHLLASQCSRPALSSDHGVEMPTLAVYAEACSPDTEERNVHLTCTYWVKWALNMVCIMHVMEGSTLRQPLRCQLCDIVLRRKTMRPQVRISVCRVK